MFIFLGEFLSNRFENWSDKLEINRCWYLWDIKRIKERNFFKFFEGVGLLVFWFVLSYINFRRLFFRDVRGLFLLL